MPCTAHISLALRSVSRWVFLPFKLASAAALLLLLRLLALALRKRTPQGSTQGRSGKKGSVGVLLPRDGSDRLPGAPSEVWVDEFDPSEDKWCKSLDDPEILSSCVSYLNRCLELSSK